MQGVEVATCARLKVAGEQTRAGLPVVECDAQLVFTRRQRADVDFAAQRDDGAGADAGIALGDALASLVEDMYGEGVLGEQLLVSAAKVGVEAQPPIRNRNLLHG